MGDIILRETLYNMQPYLIAHLFATLVPWPHAGCRCLARECERLNLVTSYHCVHTRLPKRRLTDGLNSIASSLYADEPYL